MTSYHSVTGQSDWHTTHIKAQFGWMKYVKGHVSAWFQTQTFLSWRFGRLCINTRYKCENRCIYKGSWGTQEQVLASAMKCPQQKMPTNASPLEDVVSFMVFWNTFTGKILKYWKCEQGKGCLVTRYSALSAQLFLKAVAETETWILKDNYSG